MDGFYNERVLKPVSSAEWVLDVIDSPWRYAHRSRGREATRVAVRERRPSVSRLHNSKLPSE